MSVTSTLLLRGLARGKARFACAALGVAAAAGAVVFVFSLAASNAAQAPALARRASTPWAAWRFEGMTPGPWGMGPGQPPEKKTHAESAEKKPHAESAENAERDGRARAPRAPAPSLRGLPPEAGGGVIQHSAFSIQHSAFSIDRSPPPARFARQLLRRDSVYGSKPAARRTRWTAATSTSRGRTPAFAASAAAVPAP